MGVRALGVAAGLGLLGTHCSSFSEGPQRQLEPPAEPSRTIEFRQWDPLSVVTPQASWQLDGFAPEARLVGVAVDPRDAEVRYVLEASTGLYRLTAAGAEQVFDLRSSRVLGGEGDGSPPSELTDVVFDEARTLESGSSTFALTAANAGFALVLPGDVLEEYFCYFPVAYGPLQQGPRVSVSQELRQQGVAVLERTEALAINPLTSQIVAQPRTLRLEDGGVAGSELFVFDAVGGNPVGTWQLARTEFVAGGAAFSFGDLLMLGSGADLYFSDGWGRDLVHRLRLDGVEEISGIAEADGGLLVLDGPRRRLLEVGQEQLRRALFGTSRDAERAPPSAGVQALPVRAIVLPEAAAW